jgi:hypothetical protein
MLLIWIDIDRRHEGAFFCLFPFHDLYLIVQLGSPASCSRASRSRDVQINVYVVGD